MYHKNQEKISKVIDILKEIESCAIYLILDCQNKNKVYDKQKKIRIFGRFFLEKITQIPSTTIIEKGPNLESRSQPQI